MERRKFVSALPLVAGGALALKAAPVSAQTGTTPSYVSVKQFGATGNGTTDDTAAITSAFTYAAEQPNPICIFFPDGQYLVSAGFTVPAGVTVRGSGRKSATIVVNASGITVFSRINTTDSIATVTITDLSISTTKSLVVGIQWTLCDNTYIERVNFYGCSQNFVIDRGHWHTVHDCTAAGVPGSNPCGTNRVWSSVDTDYAFEVSIINFQFDNIGNGINTGADPGCMYVRRGVGLFLNTVICFDCTTGGEPQAFLVFENDCQGCKVSNSGASLMTYGVLIQTGTGVNVSPTFMEFDSVDVDQPMINAYRISNGGWISVNGGMLTPNESYANIAVFLVSNGSSFITISGTIIYGFSESPGAAFYFNECSEVQVCNCIVDNCYFGFVNVSSTNVKLLGSSFYNISNKYNGAVAGVGNLVSNCSGINPISVASPVVPANGTPFTNTSGTRCTAFVTGGNVTGIYLNGTLTGLTSGGFDLSPGETIQLNYYSAPSWSWIGH